MLPDRVSNPGPLTYESDALPIALKREWQSHGKNSIIRSLTKKPTGFGIKKIKSCSRNGFFILKAI